MTDYGTGPNIRELALDAVMFILEESQYTHLVIRQALDKYGYLSVQERSFFTRLVQGTVERKIELDWVISQYSKIAALKMKPLIRNLLRMTAYQIMYMDAVPDSAACNEAVKLAAKRGFSGLKGFVNGISRNISRGKHGLELPKDWSIRYSMPAWIIDMYKSCAGSKAVEPILQGFLQLEKSETTVHCHCREQSLEQIIASLEKDGVSVRKDEILPDVLHIRVTDRLDRIAAFREGLLQVQDSSSILACMAAAPKQNSLCVDVCAAPGGKSVFLANQMQNTGRVYSRDLSDLKVAYIQENADRCGFTNLIPQVWDATVSDVDLIGQADLVFADLPCSGLGVIGSKPDIKYHQTPEGAAALAALQREILQTVWEYVKPGGTLIYSTCTVNPEENKGNRDWFLEQFPFSAEDMTPYLPAAFADTTAKEGYLQLMPGQVGKDGFFFARMKRLPKEQ